MSGNSHSFEIACLDQINFRYQDIAIHILNTMNLKEVIDLMKKEAPPSLVELYSHLKPEEIKYVASKVLHSKVTSIEVTHRFSTEEIEFLIQLIAHSLNIKIDNGSPAEIISSVPEVFRFTRDWLQKSFITLRQKQRGHDISIRRLGL